ncbi:hypothetical protein [Cronobacter dublinensis]|uniref:AbiTii domain-containing protein n=1 Tax=Cronobacter dublinensis TaxID=413497 RepID=UPI000CFC9107|nr:hypothetical protein [Cronobacter dublinensis]
MVDINELISGLSSSSQELTDSLLKAKILLYSIGKKELAVWVNNELTGYPEESALPDYRVLSARILIDANGNNRVYTGFQLPLSHLGDDDYKEAMTSKAFLSISQIEDLVRNSTSDRVVTQPLPLEQGWYYGGKAVDRSYEITKVYKEIPLHSFIAILVQVRSRLLDFLLELSEKIEGEQSDISMKDKLKGIDTKSIFSNAIFGNHTVVNFGNDNKITVNNNIAQYDFEALKNELIQHGVENSDINELKIALDRDHKITRDTINDDYGPSLKIWFADMLKKSATGI